MIDQRDRKPRLKHRHQRRLELGVVGPAEVPAEAAEEAVEGEEDADVGVINEADSSLQIVL